MADEKIIFSMNGVSKILPHNNRVILKDIYLGFFYGAKIGIIGLNGSGKSTLLKIIAGVEKSYKGEVVWAPGYSVGYLEQEPQMDPEKTVLEVVQEGVQEVMDILQEYNDISLKFMEPMDDDEMNRLIERQGELTEQIEHVNGWEIDSKLERAMDALQCPPSDQKIKELSGGERRRVALCRLLLQEPDVLLLDEPTNHLDTESIQWLEAHLQQYKGTVIAVTHDRWHPLEGQLLLLAGPENQAPGRRGEGRKQAPQNPGAGTGMGAYGPQGPPGQAKGPSGRV